MVSTGLAAGTTLATWAIVVGAGTVGTTGGDGVGVGPFATSTGLAANAGFAYYWTSTGFATCGNLF